MTHQQVILKPLATRAKATTGKPHSLYTISPLAPMSRGRFLLCYADGNIGVHGQKFNNQMGRCSCELCN